MASLYFCPFQVTKNPIFVNLSLRLDSELIFCNPTPNSLQIVEAPGYHMHPTSIYVIQLITGIQKLVQLDISMILSNIILKIKVFS